MTLNSTWSTPQYVQESTITLDAPLLQSRNQAETGPRYINTGLNKSIDGDFWEYYTALEATRRGATVLKNFTRSGPIDYALIWRSMEIHCDVKVKVNRSKKQGVYYQDTLNRIPPDIYMVCPHPITNEIAWHTNRIPAGWEDFWNEPTYEIIN